MPNPRERLPNKFLVISSKDQVLELNLRLLLGLQFLGLVLVIEFGKASVVVVAATVLGDVGDGCNVGFGAGFGYSFGFGGLVGCFGSSLCWCWCWWCTS
ncbi:hypothetical protein F5H01DRAFT_331074 [Linnemannia elongata]|nr:hypothetical protein F5H01DRAFT_331074 [Linnemannia elongata]